MDACTATQGAIRAADESGRHRKDRGFFTGSTRRMDVRSAEARHALLPMHGRARNLTPGEFSTVDKWCRTPEAVDDAARHDTGTRYGIKNTRFTSCRRRDDRDDHWTIGASTPLLCAAAGRRFIGSTTGLTYPRNSSGSFRPVGGTSMALRPLDRHSRQHRRHERCRWRVTRSRRRRIAVKLTCIASNSTTSAQTQITAADRRSTHRRSGRPP